MKIYVPTKDVLKPPGKHSSVSDSVIVGTRCHSTWLKHNQRIHSRIDSTTGQIWLLQLSCRDHQHQVSSM